jgi:hypothetical protein
MQQTRSASELSTGSGPAISQSRGTNFCNGLTKRLKADRFSQMSIESGTEAPFYVLTIPVASKGNGRSMKIPVLHKSEVSHFRPEVLCR